ncbi:IS21 family transposase [Paraflavitalea speifideaquila]|uniref:IS21 family transposase n=1 Tax=Paraflavitalea speifideaquila TaxID=3076558 RepID=UPI0028E3991F|nr:IS21 family transposase [Paraflavitalea speifideiaquila]
MAGQRINIMEIRTIISLKQKGWSNRKIAGFVKLIRKTIDSYMARFKALELPCETLLELEDVELVDLFTEDSQTEKERYETLAGNFSYIEQELKKPGATLATLHEEYLLKHPDGYRYTQFCWHIRQWKKRIDPSGKLTHKAAEKLFIDFCGKKLSYIDKASGEVVEVEVFIAVLPCSQYTFVKAVSSQKREDLIKCLSDCLHWMGGVPQAIVSDNLKSAVSKGHKYAPLINKTLADFALHYGCAVDPARPYHPQDKALVERSVQIVYQRIYYPLSRHTFFSLDDLNKELSLLLPAYNDYLFAHGGTTRRQQFVDTEEALLQPLPPGRYHLRQYKRAKVQKTSHIYLSEDKNYYSVPYRYQGQHVEVQYNQDKVEIFYNHTRIASHRRSYKAGDYTTEGDHMPSSHQAHNEWSPPFFEQKAGQVGAHTLAYIQRLFTQYTYPEIAYKQCQGILSLAGTYTPQRLEQACRRALDYHRSGYHTIERILKAGLDRSEEDAAEQQRIPLHDNIRGAGYYQ